MLDVGGRRTLGQAGELGGSHHALGALAAGEHHVGQALGPRHLHRLAQHLREVGGIVGVAAGDQGHKVGVADDEADLGGLVPGVQRHGHASQERHAEQRLGVLDAVGHENADVLPAADAQARQRSGRPLRALIETGIGRALVRQHQRIALRVVARRPDQQVPKRRDLRSHGVTHCALLPLAHALYWLVRPCA